MTSSSGSYSLSSINPKLLRRIYRACRPTMEEPNLALNLEICDYVNAKQGSAPRETAIAIVKLINQRDPQTSELALHLLDNLVKNCGFPFQLQISRKEFLNELVKKFPERPTLRYSRVQRMILAHIEEWYQTICKTSRYKDEFGYIRDMHRLLANKGYVFPEVKVEDAAVLNPSAAIQSLEDIQKEEAVVHSAKLQELIRRGKPQDLQEANRLMKIMAGFRDDHVQENRKQVEDDVARLRRKADIFADMLASIEASGAAIDDSADTVHELYGAVKSAQPIVGKIIEEEHDNDAYVHDLLALNDAINQLVAKYQRMRGRAADAAPPAADLNLIDFDDEPLSADASGKDEQGYQDLLSDLSNLAFTDSAAPLNPLDLFGAGGSIQLGAPLHQPVPTPAGQGAGGTPDLLAGLASPSPQLQLNLPGAQLNVPGAQPNAAANGSQLDPFGFSFPTATPAQVHQAPAGTARPAAVVHETAGVKLEAATLADSTATRHHGVFYVSNKAAVPKTSVRLMVAAAKGCRLDLRPQSGDSVYAFSERGLSQEYVVENPAAKPLRFKWKLEYKVGGQDEAEQGVVSLEQ
ncbi:VHS-domain-containing protein [Metschnikowia bicuspidata var. bicuspidata NRRL YB-4993]|uniref:VHS-domain-containing protein n=1 Tax=Metschnikowia bicuspidata var. bicuspidata NRRL YB-4993 TaxID=869754 RepID=A0A1A0HCK5_9ASCO|nr:VHS-domain-containing protein [Metschnikowia bicuspidata var. bicuspidata NRRL YB-4993]OBA21622.1 VHS-domain-containing protein [Metschnikowia bicuspidata var. bicuspidata NRRL YB-4993]